MGAHSEDEHRRAVDTLTRLSKIVAGPAREAQAAEDAYLAEQRAAFKPVVAEAAGIVAAMQSRANAFDAVLSHCAAIDWKVVTPIVGMTRAPLYARSLRERLEVPGLLKEAPSHLANLSRRTIAAGQLKLVEDCVRGNRGTAAWLDKVYEKLVAELAVVDARLREHEAAMAANAAAAAAAAAAQAGVKTTPDINPHAQEDAR